MAVGWCLASHRVCVPPVGVCGTLASYGDSGEIRKLGIKVIPPVEVDSMRLNLIPSAGDSQSDA